MQKGFSKSNRGARPRHGDADGLPPLPLVEGKSVQLLVNALAVGEATDANLVERLQTQPAKAHKPALTVLGRGAAAASSPSLYDRSIGIVRDLLGMYTAAELDALLLSCDQSEREVLLKSLLKR
jgi:hypothetical protein